jgi:transposase
MVFVIMFPHMNNKEVLRLRATLYYLNNNLSLRKTALKFHIAYCTIFKWVRLYKQKGEEGLLSTYKKPWNRTKSDLEKKIVLMKEHEPCLTVRKAQERLEKKGIKISVKGIWGIWKRYGYTGFSHKNMSFGFTDCSWSREAQRKYRIAKRLFDQGGINRSAEILNSIPTLPQNELLTKIPDSQLDIRRQIERISLVFGKIPVGTYLEQLKNLYKECCRRNLYYSALIVGLVETMALSWNGEPLKMAKKVAELKNTLKKDEDYFSYSLFGPRFLLLISLGFAYTGLLKVKEASAIAKTCRIMLKRRKHTFPIFLRNLGHLFAQLEDFEEAKYWYLRSMDYLRGRDKKIVKSLLADTYIVKGEYKKALEILRHEELDHWGSRSRVRRIRSMWLLTKGMPHRAISLATDVLASLKKEEAKGSIFGCYFTIASAYCSLGERSRAQRILKGLLPYLAKNKLHEVKTMIDILISQALPDENFTLLYAQSLPTIKVLLLLKKGEYVQAQRYARKKGLLGVLRRYVFFFPDTIAGLLEKGKPTGLPRTMLNLPVFRKEIPVYLVKFLGRIVVYKNGKYLPLLSAQKKKHSVLSDKFRSETSTSRVSETSQTFHSGARLTPKDTAFLIHLATVKNRHISLERIYNNFWRHSTNPSRNLAHLLVRIRKALFLPSHFLYIKNNRLHIVCHFITDYGEFLEHIAKAKAFLRAGEWPFARTEYVHAFSLFRAAPFKKMYDTWSEDMRTTILGQLKKEAATFAEACALHNDHAKGVETLKRLSRIVPNSDKITDFTERITNC